jgi:hypothetical protein
MNDNSYSEEDIKFKHPFTCIVSGPTGAGKSSFCIRLLQNLKTVCTEPDFKGGIVWCYSEKTAVPREELAKLRNKITYCDGMPGEFGDARGLPTLIILDDLINEAYCQDVCNLFTKGSHHRNASVILITQNLFHQGARCRDISLNAKYLIILKNVRDKNQFTFLARQVYPESPDSLYKAYLQSTVKPHSYFVLDFAQDTNNHLRFRTGIFPEEHTAVYAAIEDEEDKEKLSRTTSTEEGQPKAKKSHTRKLQKRSVEYD